MKNQWPVLWQARKRLRLTYFLLKDRRVPLWQKAIPFLPLIYIFSPLNFLTSFIPILGQIDDVMLVLLSMEILERVVEDGILAEYRTEEGEIIDQRGK